MIRQLFFVLQDEDDPDRLRAKLERRQRDERYDISLAVSLTSEPILARQPPGVHLSINSPARSPDEGPSVCCMTGESVLLAQ